jgi:hypothetical protein
MRPELAGPAGPKAGHRSTETRATLDDRSVRTVARILERGAKMPVVHFTARLRINVPARLDREHAAWLFARLRHAFPNTLAATLMPNHPHLIADVIDVAQAHATFTKILAALARTSSWPRPVWQPIPPPLIITGLDKILFQVRYAGLNPCRARFVGDPLAWYWSTYRDVVGATADPWVTFAKLRRYLPAPQRYNIQRLHEFVSSDPSVHVAGTPLPTPAVDTNLAERPLADILRAAVAATRGSPLDHRRRGPTRTIFVTLAAAQGWGDVQRLAALCDTTPRAIAEMLRRGPPPGLDAARLCLGDARLLHRANALRFAPEQRPVRSRTPQPRMVRT